MPECFYTLWLLRRTCEIQPIGAAPDLTTTNTPTAPPARADAAERDYARCGLGADLMAALLRQMDRVFL